MTPTRPTSTWPVAIGWWFAGSLLTLVTAAVAGAAAHLLLGFGAYEVQLLAIPIVWLTVVIAKRLPRRARAMFVTGVCTPIVLSVVAVIWLIWAISQSNFTF